MRIRKSLLLSLAAMAIAMTAFASSAMAADGVLEDTNGKPIAKGATLHFIGWARFVGGLGGIECHVTGTYEATGETGESGDITQFNISTPSCRGIGAFANCQVTNDEVLNLPYPTTVTPTDFDVSDEIVILNDLSNCSVFPFTFADLSFEEITLKPLKTGTRTVTNTAGNLGTTAVPGEEIAGVELEGEGEVETDLGPAAVTAEGELELTSPERCTYRLKV